MFGKDLREICEKCRLAMSDGSPQPDDVLNKVREQLLSLSDVPSNEATSKVNVLLADIEAGRVELPMYGDAGDDEPAKSEIGAAQPPTTKREKGSKKLGKDSVSTPNKAMSSDRDASNRSSGAKGSVNITKVTNTIPVSKSGKTKRKAGGPTEDDEVQSPTKKKKETPKPKPKLIVRRKPAANNQS